LFSILARFNNVITDFEMDRQEFKKYGYEVVDWLADYLEDVRKYPVRSKVKPGEVKSRLNPSPPAIGEEMSDIMKDFKEVIIPGITHWQHPGWFAYFPANNSPASVLGEMLTAGLGAQCMSWETSPAATELEEVVMDWLRQMTGLPEEMKGVIQDTASTATLTALLTAREVATGYSSNQKGMERGLRVYASQEVHSSIEKAVKIAGYGRENLCYISTDENYALRPENLEKAIKADIENGLKPVCVVATIGTTSSTAIDPVYDIGMLCRKFGVWLHVDAAMAGTALILEDKRNLLKGAEFIDSFVFNPHKWMMTNFDCSAYFVRNPEQLKRTMSVNPEYLKTSHDRQVNNYRDWGIQLGRRFRALKLWFVIRQYGVDGLKEIVRNHIELAVWFAGEVSKSNVFELMAPVSTNLVCFRWNDNKTPQSELDRINRQLLDRINDSGEVFLTHTVLSGLYTIRLAVGQRTTTRADVERAWEIIQNSATLK
jgi:aromatic-L-amino-acid/L-tryptophan decarboxylase